MGMRAIPGLEGNTGSNRLARVLVDAVRRFSPNKLAWNDFGTIQPDMSLLVDGYSDPFPPSLYFVAERLLGDDVITTSAATTPTVHASPSVSVGDHGSHDHGSHTHGPHTHTIPRTGMFRRLSPGDRVLVNWVSPTRPAVVDRLHLPATLVDPTLVEVS
jgi:hypothetical protein